MNQSGERKTLHFTTKSIVSAGDIVISSNEEKVVFYSKTFRVTNKSMGGNIYYEDESGSLQPIPSSAFVAFERVSNSSRIGAVTVTADGRYELRLRKGVHLRLVHQSGTVPLQTERQGLPLHIRKFV